MLSKEARDTLAALFPTIMDIKAAAKELKVSEITVRRLIWDGELDAYMIGSEWQINASSVIEYAEKNSNI